MPDSPENQDAGLGTRHNEADAQPVKEQNEPDQDATASPKLATAYNGAGIFSNLE